MKVAVISWKFENYGTLLQAFALNYFLNSCESIDCDFVYYELDKNNLDIPFRLLSMETPKKIYSKIFKRRTISEKKKGAIGVQRRACAEFFERIKHTGLLTKKELSLLNSQYEAFICGSDQIWNPDYFDKSYFLDFVKSKNKKIAFAPSMGGCSIPYRLRNTYRRLISRFDYLSARENEAATLISALTGRKCEHIVDPTFLLSAEEWIKALGVKADSSKRYLLCYFLSPQPWYLDCVKYYSKINNLEVICLKNAESEYSKDFDEFAEIVGGPEDFVAAIASASFVITDSFHGTLFSAFFNREFVTLQRFSKVGKKSENVRVTSFLESVNLSDRFISSDSKVTEQLKPINFESINDYIDNRRTDAIRYLFNALERGN